MEQIQIIIDRTEGCSEGRLDVSENYASLIFDNKNVLLEQLSEILSDKDIEKIKNYKKEIDRLKSL